MAGMNSGMAMLAKSMGIDVDEIAHAVSSSKEDIKNFAITIETRVQAIENKLDLVLAKLEQNNRVRLADGSTCAECNGNYLPRCDGGDNDNSGGITA